MGDQPSLGRARVHVSVGGEGVVSATRRRLGTGRSSKPSSPIGIAHRPSVRLEVDDVDEVAGSNGTLRVGQHPFAGVGDVPFPTRDDPALVPGRLCPLSSLASTGIRLRADMVAGTDTPPASQKVGARSMRLTKSSMSAPGSLFAPASGRRAPPRIRCRRDCTSLVASRECRDRR